MKRVIVPLLLASACSAAPPSPPPAPTLVPTAAPVAAPVAAPPLPWIELTGTERKTVVVGYGPDGSKLYEVPLDEVVAVVGAPDGGAFAVVRMPGPNYSSKIAALRLDEQGRETWRTPLESSSFTWRLFLPGPAGTKPASPGTGGPRLFAFDLSQAKGKQRLHELDPADGTHLKERPLLDISEADARGGVVAVVDEDHVTRIGAEDKPAWSVRVRRFPSLSPSSGVYRKVAVGIDGTVLTGASDGSLLALDAAGKPLYQLGVRGSVDRIEAQAGGGFLVRTSEGAVAVDRGVVREGAKAEPPAGVRVLDKRKGKGAGEDPPAPPPWKPTVAHRAAREGLDATEPFHHVLSVVATGPRDVWTLGRAEKGPTNDDRLFRYDGKAWSDLGVPSMSFPKEVFAEGEPARPSRFFAQSLSRSPTGALLVLGVRAGGGVARPSVLERDGAAYRERRELVATFAKVEIEYGTKLFHGSGAGGREVLCTSEPEVCVAFGRGVTPRILPDDETLEASALAHSEGADVEPPEGPLPALSTWASGRDDVWTTGFLGGVAHFDGARWWRILGIDPTEKLTVTGSGRGDVWLFGEAGLWHVTPEPRAAADLEGTPAPPPPAAAPSVVLPVTGVDTSYRLERVVLDLDGQRPLRTAIGIAEGPGGVVWLHEGARIVEYDGARARLLYEAPKPGPFFCWYAPEPDCNLCAQCTERNPKTLGCQHCLAPVAAGEGAALAAEGFLRLQGGRAASEPMPLPDLLAVAAAPSGAVWTVSAADGDLPRAMTWGPRGVRLVAGLPPAAYADVAARADDDVWFAGGLTTVLVAGRVSPEGEGTLVRFDGRAFTHHRGPDGALLSVAAVGPGEAWAVGLGGALLHAKASTVEAFHLGREGGGRHPVVLRGVSATGPNEVWIVGDGSTLLRWDGKALRRVDTGAVGPEAALAAVIAPGPKPGWVVGPAGIWRIVAAR
ncbi:hypothetical protein [Polyangium sorediatum]|uniref:Uncharacterized protein n=1 Tax=Polyangium sorediatum TaxID=889274 RepID=A0ABT6NSS1_9BACT|nr:hypothetical protein [Polyangium sorediatum]MDI1431376.1 hypothetical protein [Polyangium sorediatum]